MAVVTKQYRGELLDLVGHGHIAVVDHTGKLLYYYGEPDKIIYARSSAKPMQTLAAYETGAVEAYGLEDHEVALLCSSHNGEQFHLETVMSILGKAGLDKSYLRCGPAAPIGPGVANEYLRQGVVFEEIYNNCSGKHSGMLISAKYMNESLDDYYLPEHPVQKRIIKAIQEVCRYEDEIIIGIDGCGVPVHALPLNKFAEGYARLVTPGEFEGKRREIVERIVKCMAEYPQYVAGKGRLNTILMQQYKGDMIAKDGADGYFALGIKSAGIGITAKIDDGNFDRMGPVILETLRQLDLIDAEKLEAMKSFYRPEIKNARSEVVGHVEAAFELIKA